MRCAEIPGEKSLGFIQTCIFMAPEMLGSRLLDFKCDLTACVKSMRVKNLFCRFI